MLVQAKCPGCRTVLRIPPEWVNKAIRCKECGTVIRGGKKVAGPSDSSLKKTAAASRARDDDLDFTDAATSPRRPRGRLVTNIRIAVGAAVILASIAVGAYVLKPEEKGSGSQPNTEDKAGGVPGAPVAAATASGPFPRRLLTIQPCNYLYFDPLGYGAKPYDGHALVERLTKAFHIEPSQVAELSDAAPANSRPPMKAVIEKTVADFLKGSRRQDRVIVLFAGHLTEVEEQPFLVPLEGEPAEKKTLIPLSWLLEQLAVCPALQRVLILDVCRFDPSRGSLRQGSSPLGEKAFAALKNAPPGVQVWTACSAGQYSVEDGAVLQGSVFLHKIAEPAAPPGGTGGDKPQDPLPLRALADKVDSSTASEVNTIFRQKQTPVFLGEVRTGADAAYDPNEPQPPKLSIDLPRPKNFKPAPRGKVDAVLRLAAEIPPLKTPPSGVQLPRADLFPVFAEETMKGYETGGNDNTPFRQAVKKAVGVLKKHAQHLKDVFPGTAGQLKQEVLGRQHRLAADTLELDDTLESLVAAGKQRDSEPSKNWQAYYDYVHARLLERLAYTFEYNFAVAAVRTDALPERDPKTTSGWRLASVAKMKSTSGSEGKEFKKKADDAKKILLKIAEEHRGTPWEVLAKRDAMNALGLEWQPTR